MKWLRRASAEALAAEARHVDRATQREAVQRLTALLARHVAPRKRKDERDIERKKERDLKKIIINIY